MRKDIDVIFEDDDLIVVNKAAGMLSIPDRVQSQPSLKDILSDEYGTIFTVHRLDKETSGVIVFAKHEASHKNLSQQFENRETEKYYTGLVTGQLEEKEGSVHVPIIEHPVKKGVMTTSAKGKESVTEYRTEEEFGVFSLVKFRILTGRTHQIRVHMNYLGHPVACDELYGKGETILLSSLKKRYNLSRKEDEERPILSRLALHAEKLVFRDMAGEIKTIEEQLTKDMRALLQQLRKINQGKTA